MTMRRSTRDRVMGLIAFGSIVVLVMGIPLLLARLAGWPLPQSMPDWRNVRRALIQGDIPADTVVKTLAIIVWIIWFQVVWALMWEIAVNVPRVTAGHRPRSAPFVALPLGDGIGRLVALVLAIGVAVASSPAPALALPSASSGAHHPGGLARAPVAVQELSATRQEPAVLRWKVDQSDSLWKIAETALGDGERADEILDCNRWLGAPRHLKAGQTLELPDDAVIPLDRSPDPSKPATNDAPVVQPLEHESGPVTFLAAAQIVIEPGDTLWDLAEDRLDTVDQHVTPSETLAHVNVVIAANPDVVDDPNLIYPGEVFAFPAIGRPPPPNAPTEALPTAELPPASPPAEVTELAEPSVPVETTPEEPPPEEHNADDVPAAAVEAAPTTTVGAPPVATREAPTDRLEPLAAAAADRDGRSSALPWLVGISGATALASGILLLYRRRLAVRAARGAGAYRAAIPEDTSTLSAVTRASDISLLRWANTAIAEAMARLRPDDVDGQPLVIELSETLGIEMLWTHANPVAPDPWQVTDDGWAWRLGYDPDAPISKTDIPAAMPALVTIGRRDDNQLLLNLEAVGTLAVDGDEQATEFVRSIVTELATGELLSDAFLVTCGVELDGIASIDRVQQRDRDGAGQLLSSAVDASKSFVRENSLKSVFDARLGGDAAGRETTIVAVDDEYAVALHEGVTPGLSTCLVYTGRSEEVCVTLTPDGLAVLNPYGIEFDPVRLPLATLETVSDLLDEASEPYTPPPAVPVEIHAEDGCDLDGLSPGAVETDADLGEDDDWEFPEPAVLVRVLGAPEVIGVTLGRIETSIVTYLAGHGGRRRDEQVINAVWNGRAVEPKTLWNKISKIRSVLGADVVPPRLPNSPDVVLSDQVMTDLEVVARLHARAAEVSESEGLRLLMHGLDLIDGVPFDSAEYEWSFETQDHALACETVEAATLRCVEIAMNLGDFDSARHAVTQGLRALPMNEPLYRARMRIEAASGNPNGVRQALGELGAALDSSGVGDASALDIETRLLASELTASG